jgi:hypothetical protein
MGSPESALEPVPVKTSSESALEIAGAGKQLLALGA